MRVRVGYFRRGLHVCHQGFGERPGVGTAGVGVGIQYADVIQQLRFCLGVLTRLVQVFLPGQQTAGDEGPLRPHGGVQHDIKGSLVGLQKRLTIFVVIVVVVIVVPITFPLLLSIIVLQGDQNFHGPLTGRGRRVPTTMRHCFEQGCTGPGVQQGIIITHIDQIVTSLAFFFLYKSFDQGLHADRCVGVVLGQGRPPVQQGLDFVPLATGQGARFGV